MATQNGPGPEKVREEERADDAKRQNKQNRQSKPNARKKAKVVRRIDAYRNQEIGNPNRPNGKRPEFDEKNDSYSKPETSRKRGKELEKNTINWRRKAGESKTKPGTTR